MKVMIEVLSSTLGAINSAIGKMQDIEPEVASELSIFLNNLRTATDSWSNPTTETIIGASTLSELSLQKQLVFDPHTKVSLQKPGAYLAFPQQQSVMHLFSVGVNHTGYLVMSLQAWEALGNLDTKTAVLNY